MNGGHGVLISWLKTTIHITNNVASFQERPYQDDSITSRPLSEVKHLRVRLVLRWGTTLESLMLFFLFCSFVSIVKEYYGMNFRAWYHSSYHSQKPILRHSSFRFLLLVIIHVSVKGSDGRAASSFWGVTVFAAPSEVLMALSVFVAADDDDDEAAGVGVSGLLSVGILPSGVLLVCGDDDTGATSTVVEPPSCVMVFPWSCCSKEGALLVLLLLLLVALVLSSLRFPRPVRFRRFTRCCFFE